MGHIVPCSDQWIVGPRRIGSVDKLHRRESTALADIDVGPRHLATIDVPVLNSGPQNA